MRYEDSHPSDQELLRELDGELSAANAMAVRAHLDGCWKCRARRQELEGAIGDFLRGHEMTLPPVAGPRALLKARLAEAPAPPAWFETWRAPAAAAVLLLALGLLVLRSVPSREAPAIVTIPNPKITPGATVLRTRGEICQEESPKNKLAPVALQRAVFAEYGIRGADPRAYEVDYLITPALGGADDIRNLWPQSYAATMWNAQVKDALEDRLRELVCEGDLDLATAQREIAANWVEAYKKYFHTDRPLTD